MAKGIKADGKKKKKTWLADWDSLESFQRLGLIREHAGKFCWPVIKSATSIDDVIPSDRGPGGLMRDIDHGYVISKANEKYALHRSMGEKECAKMSYHDAGLRFIHGHSQEPAKRTWVAKICLGRVTSYDKAATPNLEKLFGKPNVSYEKEP